MAISPPWRLIPMHLWLKISFLDHLTASNEVIIDKFEKMAPGLEFTIRNDVIYCRNRYQY